MRGTGREGKGRGREIDSDAQLEPLTMVGTAWAADWLRPALQKCCSEVGS